MTEQERKEFIACIQDFKHKIAGNKELARQFLIDAGIYTTKGVLAEPYQNLYIPKISA